MKRLLHLETLVTRPFFVVSWFACAVWYAVVAGRNMARAETKDKEAILTELFPPNDERPPL